MPGSVAAMSTGSGKSQTRYRVLGQVGLALECQRFFLEMCFLGFLKGEELVKCFEMPRCLLCQQNVRHLESQRRCG